MIVVNPSTNATAFHTSASLSHNVTAGYNNNIFLGNINIYFSMWAGKKRQIDSFSAKNNIFTSNNPNDPFHMLNYTSYDATQISLIFNETFCDLRNVIESTLCRGTDFQIMNSITSDINICNTSGGTLVQQRLQSSNINHDNGAGYVEGTIVNQAFSDATRILSSDTDTLFYLTDKTNDDKSIIWTEFKVEFPVLKVENIYNQMFANGIEVEDLSHHTELINESIKIAEKIANIVVNERIMEGKLDQMFHKFLRRHDKDDLLIITSPVGKETPLFMGRFQEIEKSLERKGTYPYPLSTTFFSTRQVIGALLLVFTGLFIYSSTKLAMRRERNLKNAKISNALLRCEEGLLSSHKGLDLILEIHFTDNCPTHCELTESEVSIVQKNSDDKGGNNS